MSKDADSAPGAWQSIPTDELEGHFNPRVAVPDHAIYLQQRESANARAQADLAGARDIRYGANPRETLDVYRAGNSDAPVQVYIHGGYWRSAAKEDFAYVAAPLVAGGATTVVLGYDLCPSVALDEVVAETRRGLAWVHDHIAAHGGDPTRLFISGNSAGAHLCAMALAHDWTDVGLPADLIKGAVLITGIYDIRPVLQISVNDDIRLDAAAAERNSPLFLTPPAAGALTVAVGGGEPSGWIQQSRDYAAMCRGAGTVCEYLELPGENHFSMSSRLAEADGPLIPTILRQMGL